MLTSEMAHSMEWQDPPHIAPGPARHEVHVWRASLQYAESQLLNFRRTLTPDERVRAECFRFESDRTHYIAARGLLRCILSRYLDEQPGEIRFAYGSYGKPFLSNRYGGSLHFNLSHSHGLALFAIAEGREVGVDLELVRVDFEHLEIARRFFSSYEVETLEALPAETRTQAFYDCWTRKEAYIKARGEGLFYPLDEFDVNFRPGEKAALLRTRSEPSEASRWSMYELSPAPGYKAALVAEGHDYQLRCWQCPAEGMSSQL